MNFFRKTTIEHTKTELDSSFARRKVCAGFSGIGARPEQQDSYAISDFENPALCKEKGILLTLADGMGGLANGKEVSECVVHALQEAFLALPVDTTPDAWLLELLGEANHQVNQMLQNQQDSGSTLVMALIKGNQLYHLSIGDSRIYLARAGGLILLNREQSYGAQLDLLLLKQILPASAIAAHPQRRALTSYIGMGDLKGIDRNTVPLTLLPDDRLLLLSDGVFNALTEEEIHRAVLCSPENASIRMERMVLEHKHTHQDNFTGIIYRHQGLV